MRLTEIQIEEAKLKMMKDRVDIMKTLMIHGYVNVNWAVKNILGFSKKSEHRKWKIDRIFNG